MFHYWQVIRQLISQKQAEIRQKRPGLTCFERGTTKMDIKDIPGVCKYKNIHVTVL